MTTLLCILDGFGINPDTFGNAVSQANTKNFNTLWKKFPHATLVTHGERVGLPAGQMGNSEVGHLNIGAGRVVEQWLVRIARKLSDNSFMKSESFAKFAQISKDAPRIHFIGLASNGGVHSHMDHLIAMVKKLRPLFSGEFVLHLITDGRDTSPESSIQFVTTIQNGTHAISKTKIGSLCGRFFAMDRDKRWERTQKTYDLYVNGMGIKTEDPLNALAASHENGITDEFIEPVLCGDSTIRPEDGIIFFNFREDRMRELVQSLCAENFEGFKRTSEPFKNVLCFTEYDKTFNLPALFEPQSLSMHLGETVSAANKQQLRVAETEKYPHVTYFLNGGVELNYPGEDRKMVPSPRDVKTYDLKPEMSAAGVKEIVLDGIKSGSYDLIVVNFANCDMVGHTGDLNAAIKAVETVDGCLGEIANELLIRGGKGLVIADHGNAELMINYVDGNPHTAHTTFPVPVIALGYNRALRDDGALCDVAPTILELLHIDQPNEMTGTSLIRHEPYLWEGK